MLKRQRYMERELFKYEEKYKNIDLDEMHRKVVTLSAQLLLEQRMRSQAEETLRKATAVQRDTPR